MTAPLLSVRDLRTHFTTDRGTARAVDGVHFALHAGKTLALVGESGSGKSVTAMSILRLIPTPPGRIVSGEITFDGRNLLSLPEAEMRRIRGNDISMIFQEPMTSMNPVFRTGDQVAAVLRLHQGLSRREAAARVVELFRQVGITNPEERVRAYPHQMSGGMLQRVMIAMALACGPRLLIADEPTTALDVTIQFQILALLRKLQQETGMALLIITHDLGVVAEMADDVAVMYAGEIVEQGPVRQVFERPSHPYTQGLFNSLPAIHNGRERLRAIPGAVPAPTSFPANCRFHTRCAYAMPLCREKYPRHFEVTPQHSAQCWLMDDNVARDERVAAP
jgi:oligopeptide/dipeptide ABC transporter ATP-binding protein